MALGTIGAALQDTLLLLNGCSRTRGDICHAIGDFMAVVYSEDGANDITLVTVQVDDKGNIAAATQDSDVISSAASTVQPGIIKVADGVVAIIYDDGCSGPLVVTYVIDSSGNFGCAPMDTLDLSAGTAGIITTIHATKHDGLFVGQWFDGCGDIQAATFTIDGCGNISCLLDQQEIDASPATSNGFDMVWTGVEDYHAFAWTRTDNDGFLETWAIDSCGNFAACPADTHEFETSNAERIAVDSNDDGTLILYYEGPSSGGDVKTVTVDACGVMANGTKIDVNSITNDTTDLLRLDLLGDKNVFLGVANSAFTSWSIDACDVPSQVDTLGSILEVNDQGRLALHPNNACFAFAVGWKISTTEFFISSLPISTEPAGTLADEKDTLNLVPCASDEQLRGYVTHAINEWFVTVYPTDDYTNIKMSSVSIDNAGNIAGSPQETITLSTNGNAAFNSVIKVVDGIVVVCLRHPSPDCPEGVELLTYSVGTDGNISNCPIDTQTITTTAARDYVHVNPTNHGDVFIVTWAEQVALDIHIDTVTIDACGNISAVVGSQTITVNVTLPRYIDMVWTGVADFYAIGYSGVGADGFVATFDIDCAGNIGCVTDTHEFDTTEGTDVALTSDESGTLVATYFRSGRRIQTMAVDACGVVTTLDDESIGVAGRDGDVWWLDLMNTSMFVSVNAGIVTTWTIDGCGNLTLQDTSDTIASVHSFPIIAQRPCSPCLVIFGSLDNNGCQDADVSLTTICFTNAPAVATNPQFMGGGNAAILIVMRLI